jgi:hypothetical protein
MTVLTFLLAASITVRPEYYTNYNYYYDITGKDSLIYGATNGGLVRYNAMSGVFHVLTSLDGFRVNRQSCVALDSAGFVWSGSELGLAQVDTAFDAIRNYPIDCLPCSRISTAYCRRDTVYVGTTDGLLRIVQNGTPDDFTDDSRLNIYMENGLPSNSVTSICTDDSSVWVGTEQGLVRFTKDFSDTSVYNLNAIRINAIQITDTNIYIGTSAGLHRFNGDHFDTLVNYPIIDIYGIGDTLVLALDSTRQVGLFYGGNNTIIKAGLPSLTKVRSVLVIGNSWFCGLGNNRSRDYYGEGIGLYDRANARWTLTRGNCVASNHISCVTTNSDGVFVTHGHRSSMSRGFSQLKDDGEWIWFVRDSVVPFNNIHRCVTAPDGRVWFASNPIERWVETGDTMIAFALDPATGEWIYIPLGYKNMDRTTGVWDIKADIHGNLFLSLAEPPDKDRCWIIDSALSYVYALSPQQGGFFCETAIDSTGKIWRTIAEQPGGLVVTDTKGTLFDTGDDSYIVYDTPGGYTKNLRGIIVGGNNHIYIASPVGLIVYDSLFSLVSGISSQDLFDVEIDSEDRVWIMARDGVYWFEPLTGLIDGITYDEMGAYVDFDTTDKEVIQTQGFEYDPLRRCFWVGAETGLLKLAIRVDSQPDLDSAVIYPNPVVGQNRVRIKNLPADALVNIYSINGRRLAENLMPNSMFGEVVWDLPSGMSSGLYFALVSSDRGRRVYKFAVVR